MQAGFATLSAGSIRQKNVKNILLKNLLDACMGALTWYFIGYGIAYDFNDGSLPPSHSSLQETVVRGCRAQDFTIVKERFEDVNTLVQGQANETILLRPQQGNGRGTPMRLSNATSR